MTSGTIRARDVISSHARAGVREERRSSDADARIDREGGGEDVSASDGTRGERGRRRVGDGDVFFG